MAKGPAVVIIARHGARIDAADKQWHLTSPTPYDPPLTYGGWTQGKALGLRIAALLHARENEQAEARNGDLAHMDFSPLDGAKDGQGAGGAGLRSKRKKQKIVIHSSPFLRCVQTSTAVAAGIRQFRPPKDVVEQTATKLKVPKPSKERNGQLGVSPLAKSSSPATQSAQLAKPVANLNLEVNSKPHIGPERIMLRIDAFLGEWLSPDYFEDITPPPNSTLMVTSAKAVLLRRGDFVELKPMPQNIKGHFPGGWKSNAPSAVSSRKNTEDWSFPALGSLAQVLPSRERSSSQGNGLRNRSRSREPATPAAPAPPAAVEPRIRPYEPPMPSYAVSPSDPIPRGYCAHARDACVYVDFAWDSMRAPQAWGDGGEYGDEWSTMHKRFRKGLAGMMKWYREHDATPSKNQLPAFFHSARPSSTLHHSATDPGPKAGREDEDDEEELVLVLLTHGAGCNALLGAISNQPVLIDVGLAALSMAVRRDEPRRPSAGTLYQRRPSVIDLGMADEYEMKILASTDHLRQGVDPSKTPQPQSPAGITSPSLESRRRFGGSGGASSPISQMDSPFALGEPVRSGWNSSLGSIRRSSSSGSGSKMHSLHHHSLSGSATPNPPSGLWSSVRAPSLDISAEGRRSPGADMVLNFQSQQTKATTSSPTSLPSTAAAPGIPNLDGASEAESAIVDETEDGEKHDNVAPLRTMRTGAKRTSSQSGGLWVPKPQPVANGLWGPPKLDEVYEHGPGMKRRWTVTEREE